MDIGLKFGSGLTNGLDILAKIAANTLSTEFGNDKVNSDEVKQKRGRRRRRLADVDQFQASQIVKMANQTLVRLFAEVESDELKKTFKYACQLLPKQCNYQSQSFGSEIQAKTLMRKHLSSHVQDMKSNPSAFDTFIAESTQAKKRRIDKENIIKYQENFEQELCEQNKETIAIFKKNPALTEHDYFLEFGRDKTEMISDMQDEQLEAADVKTPSDEWAQVVLVARESDSQNEHLCDHSPVVEVQDIGSEITIDDKITLSPAVLKEREKAREAIDELKLKGSQGRDFQCKICERRFTAYGTLLSHLRSHAGFKPYVCDLCNAVFTRQHSLNYHVLLHKNETRFECSTCNRKFRHPSHFKEHLKRHDNQPDSPHECKSCEVKFKSHNDYKKHLKTRHHSKGSSHSSQKTTISCMELDKKNAAEDHDEEVAKISQKFDETEAILNSKVVIPGSPGSSPDSYYPSTGSEFSTPDPKEILANDSPNSLLEFVSFPPSKLHSPKSVKLGKQTYKHPLIQNKEKSPNLLQNNIESAFDLVKTSTSLRVDNNKTHQNVAIPMLANLNGQQVYLIPKPASTNQHGSVPVGSSKLEQCLRYGSAAAMNQKQIPQTFVPSQPITSSIKMVTLASTLTIPANLEPDSTIFSSIIPTLNK